MAEDAELIGGISVTLGASDTKLESDLAAANKMLQQWAAQNPTVQVGAQLAGMGGGGGGGGGGAGGGGGGQRTGAVRRKNIRDRAVGTEAAQNRIYTFDPEEYEREDRLREAKSTRQRELILTRMNQQTAVKASLVTRDDAELKRLTAEAEAAGGAAPTSSTFAPQRKTPGVTASNATSNVSTQMVRSRARTRVQEEARVLDAVERERRQKLDDITNRRGRRGVTRDEDDIERQARQRLATVESTALTAARTSRTAASGFGGFFGVGRAQKEAVNEQQQAEQRLLVARRKLNDPEVIRSAKAYRQATEEVTVAERDLEKATARVESFATPGTALKSLLAVTAAGAAFGLALKAVDVGLELAGKALDPTIQRMQNFEGVATRLTETLGDQTRQANGNVDAVVALANAQAGLSASGAALINPLIKQRTEIVAGNAAFTDLVATLQTYQNLRREGADAALTREQGGIFGTGLFGTPSTEQTLRQLIEGFPQANRPSTSQPGSARLSAGAFSLSAEEMQRNLGILNTEIEVLNKQLDRGGEAGLRFAVKTEANAAEIERSTKALQDAGFGDFAAALGVKGIGITGGLTGLADFQRLLKALSKGGVIPDQELLRQQFDRQRQAGIRAAGRQQDFALGTQLPGQAALQNLAAPLTPIGTGIVAANAKEQQRIVAGQQRSIQLQTELNAYYAQGEQVLRDTYNVPPQLINQVRGLGQEIAGVQARIANEQATFQVHQYNEQLRIARRSLTDILQITGQIGSTSGDNLGLYERQNLLLGRQAQELQFALSQRQINFQTALAGFQAPGVTPEERQARVKEAQIEASFAQKQLNLQQQMFRNQVKIVDISNLRQAVDLTHQIALLTEGRQVTINTALAQEQLARLQTRQEQLVAQVGTYLQKVNTLAAAAFSEIQQLEAAAGKAMGNVASDVLRAYGIVVRGINSNLPGGQTVIPPSQHVGHMASGGLFSTQGSTNLTVGEAGSETVAILRNPRAWFGGMGGGGGGVIFSGDIYVRSEADIETIARKVQDILGRKASQIGLRSPLTS